MGELKTPRKQNSKLKEELDTVKNEVQNLKTLLKQQRLQSEIECVGEPTSVACQLFLSVTFNCELK